MMAKYRSGSHTVYDIKYHFVWITKYRYQVLGGKTGHRLKDLLIQGCDAKGIKIIKGNIQKDHVHMLLEIPPKISQALSVSAFPISISLVSSTP